MAAPCAPFLQRVGPAPIALISGQVVFSAYWHFCTAGTRQLGDSSCAKCIAVQLLKGSLTTRPKPSLKFLQRKRIRKWHSSNTSAVYLLFALSFLLLHPVTWLHRYGKNRSFKVNQGFLYVSQSFPGHFRMKQIWFLTKAFIASVWMSSSMQKKVVVNSSSSKKKVGSC